MVSSKINITAFHIKILPLIWEAADPNNAVQLELQHFLAWRCNEPLAYYTDWKLSFYFKRKMEMKKHRDETQVFPIPQLLKIQKVAIES